MRQSRKHTPLVLIKWLNKKTRDSEDIYSDPGYGKHYKSLFGIEDNHQLFYNNDDIDCRFASIHESIVLFDPVHGLNEVSEYADQINGTQYGGDIKHILIPPGSNHSNANYVYKLLKTNIQNNEYVIPYVSAKSGTPYTGYHKCAGLKLNKEDFYNFVYTYSDK